MVFDYNEPDRFDADPPVESIIYRPPEKNFDQTALSLDFGMQAGIDNVETPWGGDQNGGTRY